MVLPVERRVDVAVVLAVLQAAGEVDIGPEAVQERVHHEEEAVDQVHGLVAHGLVEHHQYKIDAVRPGRDRVDLAAVIHETPVQHEDEEGRRQGDALQNPGRPAVPRRPLRGVLRALHISIIIGLGRGGEGQSQVHGLDERALVREVDGPAPSLTVYDLDGDGGHQYAKHGQKQEAAEREVPPACAQINQ